MQVNKGSGILSSAKNEPMQNWTKWRNCPLSDRHMNHWMNCSERDKPGHGLRNSNPRGPGWSCALLPDSQTRLPILWLLLSLCMSNFQLQYKWVSTHFKTLKRRDGWLQGENITKMAELYRSTRNTGKRSRPGNAHTTRQQGHLRYEGETPQLKYKTLPRKQKHLSPHLILADEHYAGSSGSTLRRNNNRKQSNWGV